MKKFLKNKKCKDCGQKNLETYGYLPTGPKGIRCSSCKSTRLEEAK